MRSPDTANNQAPPSSGGLGKIEESRRLQSIWLTVARMAAAIFTMAIPMVLVRAFDQTTFGYYKQLFLVASTMSVLALGIPGSLYYFVPRYPEASQRLQVQSAVLLAVLGVVAGLLVVASIPLIEGLFEASLGPYLPWIAVFTALSIPAELIPVSPMVDRRARLAATLVTGLDLVRAILLVLVAIITRDLMAVLLVSILIVGAKLVSMIAYLAWRRTRHPARRHPGSLLWTQLAYALPFAGTAVIGILRNKLHAYFVAASFSAADFAVYSVATLSIPLIGQFTQTVGEVVILENSKNYAAGRTEAMRRIWNRATYSLALVLVPIYVVCFLFAEELMVVLFGAQYASAAPIFRIFVSIIPLSLLLASPMLRATADLRLMLVADVVSLGVAIGALLLLVKPLGPAGAVTSLVLAKATFILIATVRSAKRLELPVRRLLPWKGLFIMSLLAAGTGVLAFLLTQDLQPFLRLVAGVGLAFGMYALIALLAGLVPRSERELILDMFRRAGGGGRRRSRASRGDQS